MTKKYAKGAKVKWNWGNGNGEGKVIESFTDEVTRTIKSEKITRKASTETPAYLIEQQDGGRVLKSHSELSRA